MTAKGAAHMRGVTRIVGAGMAAWMGVNGWAQTGIDLRAETPSVPRYGLVEFALAMDPCPGNPFDPEQVDVSLEITTPAGKRLRLPCFYAQEYERGRPNAPEERRDWLYPDGEARWQARFAPLEVGTHRCRAVRRCGGETAESPEMTFECTPAESRGFLRVSAHNPRYFEYSDGGPCFLIGQNLAFVKDTYRQEALIERLGRSGGNFARVWVCCEDWGLSLQGRKSAWGRSWDWNPPIVATPGREGFHAGRHCLQLASPGRPRVGISPSRPVPVRPATEYVVRGRGRTVGDAALRLTMGNTQIGDAVSGGEWASFEARFTTGAEQWWLGEMVLLLEGEGTAWVADLSLREAAGGAELLDEARIDREVLREVNLVDAFMLDMVVQAAERAGVFLQLVVLPRDAYWETHPALKRGGRAGPNYEAAIGDAKALIRYAVARWGYSTSVGVWEYFNEIDPESPTDGFYDALGRYLEEIDIYRHPRASSAWGPSPKDWRHPRLDAINLHHYLRPVEGEPWQSEVEALFAQVDGALAVEPRKPVLMAEFGLADASWGLSPRLKEDTRLVHLHNANWAAALSGLAGTAMPWWWDELDAMGVCDLFPPLSAFVADVPYTSGDLRPIARDAGGGSPRVVGLRGDREAYLWVSDPEATWHNAVEGRTPQQRVGETVHLPEMPAGRYTVEWWDTRTGEVSRGADIDHRGGALTLTLPPFAGDVACKVRRA